MLLLCACLQAAAQDVKGTLDEAKKLNEKIEELYSSGRFSEAIPLAERALSIRETILGPDHPDVAESLNNLGLLCQEQGDYSRAEPLFQHALKIREKAAPQGDSEVAIVLNNLAILYHVQGDYARAEPFLQKALAIDERIYGSNDAEVATDLNNLGSLYNEEEDYDRSEPLFQRALRIYEMKFGPNHPRVAMVINNLAVVYHLQGDYRRAEPLFLRALEIREKTLGADHPDVAGSLNNLATLFEAQGDVEKALLYKERVEQVRERNIAPVMTTGSEKEKQLYLNLLKGEANGVISLHAQKAPNNQRAARLAMTVILRRKGRVLDVMSDQITALRTHVTPTGRRLLDELAVVHARLSNMILQGQGRKPEVKDLQDKKDRLEAQISQESVEFRLALQPVTIERVQESLPLNSSLVEFASYKPFDPKEGNRRKKYGPPRYAVYVLRQNGDISFSDLGETAVIDAEAIAFRKALQSSQTAESKIKRLARILDERIMRPVRRLTGPVKQIFLSPDGTLNLIPFEALVDEKEHYLISTYSLIYLTSGRDLLRTQDQPLQRGGAVIIANPQFDLSKSVVHCGKQEQVTSNPEPVEFTNFAKLCYSTLDGTGEEAVGIRALIPDAKLLVRQEATETNLKAVHRPRILHIATHGFFLSDQPDSVSFDDTNKDAAQLGAKSQNPLLRSGLILTGVNQRASGKGNDGVVTALELSGLDLFGTKLVILSACETGLGDVVDGQGVYGLRRALVLAGSETQVISLWKVSDAGTRDLMVAYYRRLKNGEGRSEALRQVQLMMLRRQLKPTEKSAKRGTTDVGENRAGNDYRHPFYWAAFFQSGDWRSLNNK